jgi:LPXTG-motif cell wall-anchored protein
VAQDTKVQIEETTKSAASTIETMWQRIDERRLKNRSRDELVAWAIMGILVGSVIGLFRVVRTNAQHLGDIALGLVGALLAGFVVNMAQVDLGMGPVLIRYEDLLFSLIGGLFLVFMVGWVVRRRKKKISAK